jgi:predicted ATPase
VLRALAIANVVRANFNQAVDYSEQLLDLAEIEQDSVLVVEGCYVAGVTRFWLGDFLQSQAFLERAMEFYQPEQSRLHISLYAQDPQVICLSRLAFTLWCLGYPAKAVEASQTALDRAVERGHRFSTTYARIWDARLHLFLRNISLVEQKSAELVAFCREHQDTFWLQEAEAMLAWVQAERGEVEAGIASIYAAMETSEALGMVMERPFFLLLQARLHGQSGDLERGLQLLDEALNFIEKTEGRWCEAEVYRCQGELYELNGEDILAEAAFRRAMETARRQSARMLELRAALALGRMWLRQGKCTQAKSLIAPLFGWFKEGLDTPDLQDARLLLAETESNSEINPNIVQK